jgi:phosphoglycolate phosphatase
MNVRAVFFDLDGTLVDSLPDLTDAVNQMLACVGRAPLAISAVRSLIGQGARNLVRRALGSDDALEIEAGLKIFLAYNLEHIVDKSRLYPGVGQTLETLVGQGISLAAVSNKNEALSRLILEALGIGSFFKIICGGDTFEEMKPSPLPLIRVAERLNVPAGEVVMVGDSINDMQAGLDAGMVTIGCDWGYGSPEELLRATFRASSCSEVARILLRLAAE